VARLATPVKLATVDKLATVEKLAIDTAGNAVDPNRCQPAVLGLAIEVLREENSGLRQGKTYRVYGMAEILRRRKEAGYVWTFRNRSAVALVKMTPVDKISTVTSLSTAASMRATLARVSLLLRQCGIETDP
jgi:hypothetical protein